MSEHKRRDFLKLAAIGATVPTLSHRTALSVEAEAQTSSAKTGVAASGATSDIPTVETMRSVTMPHRFGDLFNPPGLTNQWGCAQAAMDVVAVRSIAFPPFAQGEMNVAPLGSGGELLTGVLFVDGQYFASTKEMIDFTWQPDRVERRARYRDLELSSVMIVPFKQMSVAVKLTVENKSRTRRPTEIKLAINGGSTKSVAPWNAAYSPGEFDNSRTVDRERAAILCQSKRTKALVLQGAYPLADEVLPSWLIYKFELAPGEKKTITFANVLGEQLEKVQSDYDALVRDFDGAATKVRDEWNAELRAAFTPGNNRFSGHLPTLVTNDDAVRRLYHSAVMSALFFKRTTPHSTYGTTYVTLAPRYWETTTFIWDISLSAMLLAMLDPVVLRRMMETWMQLDIHKHFGTEFLTGAGVGPWYSVNDFAMCRMAREYLRWTGDKAWLDKEIGGVKVVDRLVGYAEHWRELDTNKHGLADYGGVSNLLEAVSSYVHEVAGMNAANVYNLRFAAELLEGRGMTAKANSLRLEAVELGKRVLELYVPGKGIWRCRLPDGSYNEVHHCYDFGTVLVTIGDLLSPTQKREMVRFFREELQTPTWMRALSTKDLDVTFSIRPDHQWTGAYAAWAALAVSALYTAGEGAQAFEWIKGLAKTAMQGPIAQAHFAETAVAPEAGGGAIKAPSDPPYINDWACVAGCAYLEPIVDSLFGVQAGLSGSLTAKPNFGAFDARAELRNLSYQGRTFHASVNGVRPA
ncbi:MAG: glycoside hydrolase family 92 protein [Pyrinomonadaceae bacterium MAG19_C2-C3]|nr:glycoside hydrolase family 92 protein [Pyrinomonadaceae bacterium MAG19_C2-C3]